MTTRTVRAQIRAQRAHDVCARAAKANPSQGERLRYAGEHLTAALQSRRAAQAEAAADAAETNMRFVLRALRKR